MKGWSLDEASGEVERVGENEEVDSPTGHPAPYLTGLRLAGRRVVVIGGGQVASRRSIRLLEAGADLCVVSPHASPRLASAAARGELTWMARPYRTGDLAGAWYVLAATDDEQANRAVSAEAEALRVFCVRADRA